MKKTDESEKEIWRKLWQERTEMNFLQTEKWQEYSEKLGRKTVQYWTQDGGFLGVVRDAKRGRYLELPAGPIVDWGDLTRAKEFLEKAKELARAEGCVFVRFRPQILENAENMAKMQKLGARRALMHLAAENTVMIDLTVSEEEILKRMRRQTRYEVKKAEKSGIIVWKGRCERIFEIFFQIQAETARRQGFIPPSKRELKTIREVFGEHATMYVAMVGGEKETGDKRGEGDEEKLHRGELECESETEETRFWTEEKIKDIIAMGLILDDGREGEYYEAASTDLNRKMPGAYALQWAAIRDLKKRGLVRYNLFGIAPAGHKHHRYAGVTTFKTGFGGEVVNYVPAQDLVIEPVRYKLVEIVEGVRKKVRKL